MTTRTPYRARVASKLTKRAALELAAELGRWAQHTGSYAHGWAAMIDATNPDGAEIQYRVNGPMRTRGRWHGLTMAGARGQRRYRTTPDRLDWYSHARQDGTAPTTADDESMRARMEAWGMRRWAGFNLPPLTYHDTGRGAPARLDAPGQPGTVGHGAAQGPGQPAPSAPAAPQLQPAPGRAGGPPSTGGGFSLDGAGSTAHVEGATLDRAWACGAARKLRSALNASTARRREPDHATGRNVNRAGLARLGMGLNLRPFERLAQAHAPSTAIALAIDASGSMCSHAGDPSDYNDCATLSDRVRDAALAVSEACGREVALHVTAYAESPTTIADWGRAPAQRAEALRTRYHPSGGTRTHKAAEHCIDALMRRREKRRALVIMTDGSIASNPQYWTAAARKARAAGIEVYAVIATGPAAHDVFRAQWASLPDPFGVHVETTGDRGREAAQGIVDAVERVMRREMQRAS